MKVFDLYGHKDGADLESVRHLAERALGVVFAAHESSYVGDYYRHGLSGAENFVLQRNFNKIEQEWTEKSFKEYPVLLYVNESQRAEGLEESLTPEGFVLVRREKL